MAKDNFNLSGDLKEYVATFGHRKNPVQEEYRDYCHENLVNAQLSIPLEQAQFMEMLVRLTGVKRILEIGVYAGFSTMALAMGLPEDGEVLGLEKDERFPKMGKPFWERAGVADKITIRFGDARDEILKIIEEQGEGSFDFAFIDADKNAYLHYYENCLKLIRSGGFICLDNVLWQGRVGDPDDQSPKTVSIREINKMILDDNRVEMFMLPMWDGLTILQVK